MLIATLECPIWEPNHIKLIASPYRSSTGPVSMLKIFANADINQWRAGTDRYQTVISLCRPEDFGTVMSRSQNALGRYAPVPMTNEPDEPVPEPVCAGAA